MLCKTWHIACWDMLCCYVGHHVFNACDVTRPHICRHYYVGRDVLSSVTWLIVMWTVIYSQVWRDTFTHLPGFGRSLVWCDMLCCITCVVVFGVVWHVVPHNMCYDMLCLVWYDKLCAIWLFAMSGMSHCYARHDWLVCETWLIGMWDMTHWYVGHDVLLCETRMIGV